MTNFCYIGVKQNGQLVRGVLSSANKKAAFNAVKLLGLKQSFSLSKLLPERTFLYKAQVGQDKPLYGEQKAFEKSEVEIALRNIGYKVISVKRKLFSLQLKPPYKEIVTFVRICADLLRDKLPYDEILHVLGTDVENTTLKNTLKQIGSDLKEGKEGKEVFGKHARVFGKFPAYMLGVASSSGDMAAVYDSTARFMERDEEFKKNLRQALLTPAVIMLFMLGAVIFYVTYIFPETVALFTKYNIDIPPMTAATIMLSEFLQDNFFLILLLFAAAVTIMVQFVRSEKGRYAFDKLLIRIPYVGTLIHKTSIEIFSRVFNALYSESGDNIKVIKIAAEACRNKFMESQIISVAIPLMLKDGRGLVESLEDTGAFTKTAISRFRSGSESGALKSASLQLANYYEKETTYKMKTFIEWVNIWVSVIIVLIVIALTIISSETAVMSPNMSGIG